MNSPITATARKIAAALNSVLSHRSAVYGSMSDCRTEPTKASRVFFSVISGSVRVWSPTPDCRNRAKIHAASVAYLRRSLSLIPDPLIPYSSAGSAAYTVETPGWGIGDRGLGIGERG